MAKMNNEILSEINAIPDSEEELRNFLIWIIEFENENADKEQFSYKNEITHQLDTMTEK